MNTYLNTSAKITINEYPYGFRQKTTAYYSLEFNSKKGFRSVFQTVNPKNNRLNAEKKSTYAMLKVMHQDENNMVSYTSLDFNGGNELNKAAKFIGENFGLFTPEQIEYFYIQFLFYLKIEAISSVQYCGAKLPHILAVLSPSVKLVTQGLKTKENIFNDFAIDLVAVKNCEVEGYSPFRMTEAVSLSSL